MEGKKLCSALAWQGARAYLYLDLQLFVQERPLLQDLSFELLLVFEEQSRELAGILLAPLLFHTLLALAFLSRLFLFFIYLIQNILHHLVTHNHSREKHTTLVICNIGCFTLKDKAPFVYDPNDAQLTAEFQGVTMSHY